MKTSKSKLKLETFVKFKKLKTSNKSENLSQTFTEKVKKHNKT